MNKSVVNSQWSLGLGKKHKILNSKFETKKLKKLLLLAGNFVLKGPYQEETEPRMNANGGRVIGYELEDIGERGRRDFLYSNQ